VPPGCGADLEAAGDGRGDQPQDRAAVKSTGPFSLRFHRPSTASFRARPLRFSALFLDASCRFSSAASFRSQQREGQIARDKDVLQAQLLETIDGSLMQKKQPAAFQARASLTKWLEENRLSRHALKFLEIGGQVFH
jgi:hypothetical protein